MHLFTRFSYVYIIFVEFQCILHYFDDKSKTCSCLFL